ncbi:hypothetical protein HELRODRAFT_164284 [Helobdella robusta]|uniref:BTB domain-containing protein n=1 Tax=Helobdella robusta TaxID=6412 RepID=T1EV74_HELRO|nr:hypothetical protein HELRODRAFT_164284 [Helobdella robusta]ESN94440.1 hypothetical protein HELRODRAFT_164284 [Helobdella robusta]
MKASETKKPSESANMFKANDCLIQNQSNSYIRNNESKKNPEAMFMLNSNSANDAFNFQSHDKENKKSKKNTVPRVNSKNVCIGRKPAKNENAVHDFENTSVKTISPEDWKLATVAGDDFFSGSKPPALVLSTFENYGDVNNSAIERVLSRGTVDSNTNEANLYFQQERYQPECPSQAIVQSYLNKRFKFQAPDNEALHNDVTKKIMKEYYKNWLSQTMCDLAITTENGDVLTHQIILATYSPTLETLINQNKRPLSHFVQINMTDYPRDAVADVLNFLYTTNLKVDCKNIASLVAIARQLDLPEIINMCGIYLTKNFDQDSIFLHYSVAANNQLKNSKNFLLKVIASNFSVLVHHNHFKYIPVNRLKKILTHESLSGEELEILLAVIKWIDFNRADRTQYARQLFSHIRFELVDPEAIANQVEVHDWLFSDKSNKDIISEAYKFHALERNTENSKIYHRTSKQILSTGLDIHPSECVNDSNNTNKLWVVQQPKFKTTKEPTDTIDRHLEFNSKTNDQSNINKLESVDTLNEMLEHQKKIQEAQLQLEKIQRQILERNSSQNVERKSRNLPAAGRPSRPSLNDLQRHMSLIIGVNNDIDVIVNYIHIVLNHKLIKMIDFPNKK